MPYADKDQARKWHRETYGIRYWSNPSFAAAESDRKRDWYQRNREKVIARVLARRTELRKKGK